MANHPRIKPFIAALIFQWIIISSAGAYAQAKSPSSKKTDGAPLPAGNSAAVARGLIAFRDRCVICHFSESDARKIGPGLKGIYRRGKFSDGGKVDDGAIENRIMNGGKDMPPFRSALNSNQVRDLIAYLRTLH